MRYSQNNWQFQSLTLGWRTNRKPDFEANDCNWGERPVESDEMLPFPVVLAIDPAYIILGLLVIT